MPNGILVMDINSKEVVLANKEMEHITNNEKESKLTLKERISNFLMYKIVSDVEGSRLDHDASK